MTSDQKISKQCFIKIKNNIDTYSVIHKKVFTTILSCVFLSFKNR